MGAMASRRMRLFHQPGMRHGLPRKTFVGEVANQDPCVACKTQPKIKTAIGCPISPHVYLQKEKKKKNKFPSYPVTMVDLYNQIFLGLAVVCGFRAHQAECRKIGSASLPNCVSLTQSMEIKGQPTKTPTEKDAA